MELEIDRYNEAERDARIGLSQQEIRAFAPLTFNTLGFPTYAHDEKELLQHVDWCLDPGNQKYFEDDIFIREVAVRTVFTEDEAKLINQACDQVVDMTGSRIGRALRPICNPLAKLGIFRVISALARVYEKKKLSVFEIGPGSGYTGAYLINQGHQYASMDNTQSLYLWQNRLWDHIAPGEFVDWADPRDPEYRKIARVTHVPWWEYLKFFMDCPIKADIIVSEANLGEMSREALRFVLKVSLKMMEDSDVKLFIFCDYGFQKQNDAGVITQEFKKAGYELFLNRNFFAFGLSSHRPKLSAAALEKSLPLYNPSKSDVLLKAEDFMRLPYDQRPLDLDFTLALEDWAPPVPE